MTLYFITHGTEVNRTDRTFNILIATAGTGHCSVLPPYGRQPGGGVPEGLEKSRIVEDAGSPRVSQSVPLGAVAEDH